MKRFYPYNLVALMACLVIGLFVFHHVSTSQTRINPPESTSGPAATQNTLPTVPVILPTEPTPEEPASTETDPVSRPPRIVPGTLPIHNRTTEAVPETPAVSSEETTEEPEETTEQPADTRPYTPPTQTRYVPPTTRYTPPTMPRVTTVPIQTEEDYDFRGSVIVIYMDLNGEILDKDDPFMKDVFETPYAASPKEFSGYHYVGLAEGSAPASGVIQKGALQVIYVYEKHIFEVKNAVDAEVGKEGYTGDKVCANCGYTEHGETIPALTEPDSSQEETTSGSDLPTETNPPSSEEPQETTPEETPPSESSSEETEPQTPESSDSTECQHSSTHKEGQKDATCSEAGYTGDDICDSCGAKVASGEPIPATGQHTTELRNQKAPSCTEDGYSGDEVCVHCGTVVSQGAPIPAKGHAEGVRQGYREPAVGVPGYTGDLVCPDCGTVLEYGSEIPALTEAAPPEPPADTPADNPLADTP